MYLNISILGQPAAGPALILDGRRDQTMEFSEDFLFCREYWATPKALEQGKLALF